MKICNKWTIAQNNLSNVRSNHFVFSLGKKSKNKKRNENSTDII